MIKLIIRSLLLLLLLLCTASNALAQDAAELESRLKAAFIYNFTKFVEWPEASFQSEAAPFVICTHCCPEIKNALSKISGKKVGGRNIRIKSDVAQAGFDECNVFYFGTGYNNPALSLQTLTENHVLVVGEQDTESMIQFFSQGNKLRFIIDHALAKEAGLRIHPKLLDLASVVLNR